MNGRSRLSWPETALNLAFDIANYRSEDPFVQVGAVAIKHDGSVIVGYNGAPAGVDIDWSDRDKRRVHVLHAEENVLMYVKPGEVAILAVTHLPCVRCLNTIKQQRIETVYYRYLLENTDVYCAEHSFQKAEQYKITLHKL